MKNLKFKSIILYKKNRVTICVIGLIKSWSFYFDSREFVFLEDDLTSRSRFFSKMIENVKKFFFKTSGIEDFNNFSLSLVMFFAACMSKND